MTTRSFTINREQDITGISGTGHVADGVVFPDGTTVVRWRDLGGPAAERGVRPTTVVFESIDAVEALHGHNGATRIVWGASTAVCKHCDRTIVTTRPAAGWVHADGVQNHLGRCHSDDSGLPYGYNAEPEGEPCSAPCLGSAATETPTAAQCPEVGRYPGLKDTPCTREEGHTGEHYGYGMAWRTADEQTQRERFYQATAHLDAEKSE